MAGQHDTSAHRPRRRQLLFGAVVALAVVVPTSASELRASSTQPFTALATPTGLNAADRVAPPKPPPPPVKEVSLAEHAAEVIRLTNVERAKAGLRPLQAHSLLTQAAAAHANDQAEVPCAVGYLSHVGSDGSRPLDRIQRTGINISRWAENVACAYQSPSSVVRGWMNSPGHRANILNPLLTHIGVAISESSSGRRYWVQDFATLR